jgi:UDP-GlcNAc:undecaprenyl-phosphate GlcNAc-1-phosphate transferase
MQITLQLAELITVAIAITASLLLAFVISPFAILLARQVGLIDYPGAAEHKRHSQPTPLAGGIILMLSLPILMSIWNLWNAKLIGLFIGTSIIFIFGLLDDYFGFSATLKFTGQISGGLVLLFSGISVHILETLRPNWGNFAIDSLHILITLLWIVGITNAFNLTDSMDGLTAGLAAVSTGFFTLASLIAGQLELAQLSAILFGIALALYTINMTPAFSFLGDSGAQSFGFLLAGIGILYQPNEAPQGSTWFVPILLVAVPIFDTALVTISRLRRGKPVFQADLAHTYHRLVKLGIPPNKAVFLIQLVALFSCNTAFIMISFSPTLASIVFGLTCFIGIILIAFLEIFSNVE